MILLICFGFILRKILWNLDYSWSNFIFVNWFCNIDLYVGGFIFSLFCLDKKDFTFKKVLRPASVLLLIFFLIINCVLRYLSGYGYISYEFIKIVCPTLILLIILICLYAFDVQNQYYNLGNTKKEKIIKFPKKSFTYYKLFWNNFF